MSKSTLAYYKVKSPASILNSGARWRGRNRKPIGPAIRPLRGLALPSIALRLLASALIILLAGVAQAQRPAASTHIVRPGETLGLIAQSYGIDLSALASANGISDAHIIYSWQLLTIPSNAVPRSVSINVVGTHIVRPGESLGSIAEAYGLSLYELQEANNIWSWLIHAGQELKIPSGSIAVAPEESTEPAESAAPPETSPTVESSGITHKVQSGEALGTIARDYGVSLLDLQSLNGLWTSIIYVGQKLDIPAGGSIAVAPEESAEPVESEAPPETSPPVESSGITHKVQFGETLGAIARDYGVSLVNLQSLNGLWTSIIYVGQKLDIPAGGSIVVAPEESAEPAESPAPPETSPPVESSGITHKVQFGDTLGTIARNYGVSIVDLQSLNGLWTSIIYVGQKLDIPAGGSIAVAPEESAEPAESPAPPETIPPVESSGITHKVQFGEALGTIARDYGVSLVDLQSLNGLWTTIIYVGQELKIPSGGNALVAPEESAEPAEIAAPPETSPTVESSGITHKVQFGESLGTIARDYGVSIVDLQSLNGLWTTIIYVGQNLDIPAGGSIAVAPEESTEPAESAAPPETSPTVESSGITHKVQSGEALGTIARDYGVSLVDLQSLNGLWTSIIHVGQNLDIPAGGKPPKVENKPPEPAPPVETSVSSAPVRNPAPAPEATTHTVQAGETLFRIAKRYGVSLDALIRANGIVDVTRIHSGLVLRLSDLANSAPQAASQPAPSSQPAPAQAAAQPPAPAPAPVHHGDRERYIVRRGDFLTQLGIDLNTSWIALARLNQIADPNRLNVGSTLLIPKREDVELYDPKYAAWKYFDMIAHQPGPRVGAGREIVIVLGTQSAYAYENGVLQKAARVSAGKRATPTIKGDHKIWLKRRSQTMSGPGYSLDNVEWVMYFYKDYAIHGAWWHMNFGTPMSHGCVNLTNEDAQWFFNFASIGTPVYVRS